MMDALEAATARQLQQRWPQNVGAGRWRTGLLSPQLPVSSCRSQEHPAQVHRTAVHEVSNATAFRVCWLVLLPAFELALDYLVTSRCSSDERRGRNLSSARRAKSEQSELRRTTCHQSPGCTRGGLGPLLRKGVRLPEMVRNGPKVP